MSQTIRTQFPLCRKSPEQLIQSETEVLYFSSGSRGVGGQCSQADTLIDLWPLCLCVSATPTSEFWLFTLRCTFAPTGPPLHTNLLPRRSPSWLLSTICSLFLAENEEKVAKSQTRRSKVYLHPISAAGTTLKETHNPFLKRSNETTHWINTQTLVL